MIYCKVVLIIMIFGSYNMVFMIKMVYFTPGCKSRVFGIFCFYHLFTPFKNKQIKSRLTINVSQLLFKFFILYWHIAS